MVPTAPLDLRWAADALGLNLSDRQAEQLTQYATGLSRWNRTYNLTAIRDPAEVLTHHLVDCLAVMPPLERHLLTRGGGAARVLDVGSGGGLPAVVLAVMAPELHIVAIDAVAKKVAFIRQMALELELRQLVARHGRVEDETATYDVITSRAFATVAETCRLTRRRLATGGVWMFMKGRWAADEAEAAALAADVFHVERLSVPGLPADRHLVWARPHQEELAS